MYFDFFPLKNKSLFAFDFTDKLLEEQECTRKKEEFVAQLKRKLIDL